MVIGRTSSARQVVQANAEFGPIISRKCDADFGAGAGEQTLGTVERFVTAMVGYESQLKAADEKVLIEREQSLRATALKHASAEACREAVIPFRDSVTALFGSDYARELGFTGPTPDQPEAVLSVTERVLERVKKFPAPASRFGEASVDPIALSKSLEAPCKKLADALEDDVREQRQSTVAQLEKDELVANFDRAFSTAANLLSSLLDYAGNPTMARKVRPSRRRPGNTVGVGAGEADVELPAEPTPTASVTETPVTTGK
jgi:hypothetical protein